MHDQIKLLSDPMPFKVDEEKLVSFCVTPMYVYTKTNILDPNLGFRFPNLKTDNGTRSIQRMTSPVIPLFATVGKGKLSY